MLRGNLNPKSLFPKVGQVERRTWVYADLMRMPSIYCARKASKPG